MSIADIRREYALTGLRRKDLDPDPIQQFQKWFQQAVGARTSRRVLKLLVRCTNGYCWLRVVNRWR